VRAGSPVGGSWWNSNGSRRPKPGTPLHSPGTAPEQCLPPTAGRGHLGGRPPFSARGHDGAGFGCAVRKPWGESLSINNPPISSPPGAHRFWLALALLAAALTVLYRTGSLPLIIPDEGRNAEVAREMKASGAWLVPTYNGLPYLDKPAFYFKAVALSLAVFGDNELGARMPSALFGLGVLLVAGLFARRELGNRAAAITVLVVATTPLFISQARLVIFDIALACFVCASIVAGYIAETVEGPARRRWYLAGAAAAGLATLVKGPVGFVVPLVVLGTHHAVERRWRALGRLLHPLHIAVVLAVVLPWFVGVSRAHPDFPHYGLVEESFKRFTTPQFRRTQPVYFYPLVIAGTFFPWSLLLPAAATAALRRWRGLPGVSRFAIVWCLSVVVFFSLSKSKLPAYILSIVVPFGLLVAQLAESALNNPQGRAARLLQNTARALAILCAVLGAALIVAAPQTGLLPRPIEIPRVDLTPFLPSFLPVLLLLTITAASGAVGAHRRDPRLALATLALLPMLLIPLGSGVFSAVFERRSTRGMAARLSRLPPETEFAFLRCFPNGLPFYLRETGTLVTTDGGELTSNYVQYSLKRSPDWPPGVVRVQDFDRWLAAQKSPVYLMIQDHERDRFEALARKHGATVDELPRRFRGVLLPPRSSGS